MLVTKQPFDRISLQSALLRYNLLTKSFGKIISFSWDINHLYFLEST